MNITRKELPQSSAELTIELSNEEMRPYLEQAAAELSQESPIPGFRPGKAPYDVVAQRVGPMRIYQHAAEKAVSATYPKAVEQEKLQTVGSPTVNFQKVAPDNPLVYTATVALLPSVKLGEYGTVKEAHREVKVEPKDIDETMASLQKMFAKEAKVDRPVQQGDRTIIDMQAFVDNIPMEGGTSKEQPVVIGEGNYIPGFEEALVGMKPGEKKEFTLKFPKEYHRKDLASKPVEFRVTVKDVMERQLPPVDESFAKTVGNFSSLDELKKKIEGNIKQEREQKERQRWELAVIDKLIKQSQFGELPNVLLTSELDKMMHELEHEVGRQGMKFEDYLQSIKKTREALREEFKPRAEKRLHTALVLRAIAKAEQIAVSQEELEREIAAEKERNKNNQQVLQQLDTEDFRDYMRTIMRSRKVFEFLDRKATT